jgi:hypothetical protein
MYKSKRPRSEMFLQKIVSFSLDKRTGAWYNVRVVTGVYICTSPTIQRQQVPVKRGRKVKLPCRGDHINASRRIPVVCLCESFSVKRALREKDFFFCPF